MNLLKIEIPSGAGVWINPDAVVQLVQNKDLLESGYYEIVLMDGTHYSVRGTPNELIERIKRDENSASYSDPKPGQGFPAKVPGKFRKG